MPVSRAAKSVLRIGAAETLWVVLAFPGLLAAQETARAALASFPADTRQISYLNLAQLRSSPDYPQVRQNILSAQFHVFQLLLRSAGIDPEKDVDELMVGCRGQCQSASESFGMAGGRFEPDKVGDYFRQAQLPVQSYAGYDLFVFGSGGDPADTFFAILNTSLAAFGRLHDLRAILDAREGSAQALSANETLRGYEAELEGGSPQWGILTGKAAANAAAPWLSGGKKSTIDLTAFLQPVRAVLYRVDWDGGFTAHISLVCDTSESAAGLLKFLNIIKSASFPPPSGGGSAPASLLQNLDARQNGSRLELSASGPADALGQMLKVE